MSNNGSSDVSRKIRETGSVALTVAKVLINK
jgi:hypothetical protein